MALHQAVRKWHENASKAWHPQTVLDQRFHEGVSDLEEAVIYIGEMIFQI